MPRPADPNAKIDLLRAAEAVFVERGVDHAKIEEITERAGHSKGAFYLHFTSKEDCFRQIVESMLARLAGILDDAASLQEGISLENVGEYLERWRGKDLEMFEFMWSNRRVVRLMLAGGGSAAFGYLIDQFAEWSRQSCMGLLQWGKGLGIYRRDLDVENASLMLSGAYDRVARAVVRAEKKPDLMRLLADVQRFCLAGMATAKVIAMCDSKVNNGAARDQRTAPRIQAKRSPSRARNVRRSPVS
jgi:AcrR family transcriptional regulator